MKLLEKQQINKAVQDERKLVIDSGIALAKKVDVLRQELPSLEKQRADFIATSKETIENELKDLRSDKGALLADIKEATKTLAVLREPLDAEWNQLELEKDEVFRIKTDSDVYFQSIIVERKALQDDRELISELKQIAQQNEQRSSKLLIEIEQDRSDSKKLRQEAQTLKDSKQVELYLKEQGLLTKEQNLIEREETLKKERFELNKEKKLLALKKQRIR